MDRRQLFEIEPKWGIDFFDDMYYQDLNGLLGPHGVWKDFDDSVKRTSCLKDPAYAGYEEIRSTFYGRMLKRVLQSTDPNFKEQVFNNSGVIAIVFELYEKNATLQLNAYSIDKTGLKKKGTPIVTSGRLYELLESEQLKKELTFTFSTAYLLDLLGFSVHPTCHKTELILYPVITEVYDGTSSNILFALACEMPPQPDNKPPAAYAPPCPPFCYPKRIIPVTHISL